jgi:ABC-2 type transport system permease protein
VIVPFAILGFAVLPSLAMRSTGGTHTVAVVTGDQPLFAEIERLITPASRRGGLIITVRREPPAEDSAEQRALLKRQVLDKQLSAAVIIPRDVVESGKVEYLSTNVSAFRLMERLESAVSSAVVHRRLVVVGVAVDQVGPLTKPVDMVAVRISQDLTEHRNAATERSFVLSYVLSFLLYMTLMFYGYFVMRGVLEEKSSRIVEVVVGNVRPFELMLGKIVGIGAVGLTQYSIWVVVLLNLSMPGLLIATGQGAGDTVLISSPWLLFFFVVFFVLGYFLFSTFYAAVGAAFNTEEEAQQLQTLVSLFIALPMALMFVVLDSPDSTLSVILSLFPPFAPMLFFVRMTVQFPPAWQTVLCLVLLVATILGMARIAAAVYRVGILMYGKKPTIAEILRWVRSS